MKINFWIALIVFLAVVAAPGRPQGSEKPLTKDQVMQLAKNGMETPELVKLIREHGIDFDLSDDYLQDLRKAGAEEPVIQALRTVRPKALTRDQVLQLLTAHVPSEHAAALVRLHGIDFLPDDQYFEMLRLAGADNALVAAVRTAGESLTAQLEVTTSPNAEVYLDGRLLGRADGDGRLAANFKPGTHALKVTLAGKQDFEQKVTLIARQVNKLPAVLADPAGGTPVHSAPNARGYLGIQVGDYDDFFKQFFGSNLRGVLAQSVVAGGPADKAGLKANDNIVKLNGQVIKDVGQFTTLVANLTPGTVATLDIKSGDHLLALSVTVGERPSDPGAPAGAGGVEQGSLHGIVVEDLTPANREHGSLPPSLTGVVITQLDPKSPGADGGLLVGDVIVGINRQPVRNIRDFTLLGAQANGQTLLRINRSGKDLFVAITPDEVGTRPK
jgi:hypothetical protein